MATGPLYAQENYEVHAIELRGNAALSDDNLLSRMSTYATGGFNRKILGKDPYLFSNDILQGDLKRLKSLYQREGFLDVLIELDDLDINSKNNSVNIYIMITENAPILTGTIALSFNDTIADFANSGSIDILNELAMESGARFRDSLVYQDQAKIVRLLENSGYPYAKAEPELLVDRQKGEVDIEWRVEPGPLCRFGDIKISGLRFASDKIIQKSLLINPGDIFSRTALKESQRRIYGLSIFHVVTVKAKLNSEQTPVIPVEIKIDEAPRLSSRIGVGYGREDRFRAYSDSRLLGFLGGARQLNLYLKHSYLEPYHVRLRFRQPAFLTGRTTLLISPFVLRQKEPAFDLKRYGDLTTLLHQLSSNLHGSATYSFERVILDTSSIGDLAFDTTGREDLYAKSGIKLGLTFDNSAPLFSPDRGTYAAGAITISGLGLGSKYHYKRLLLDVRRYQKLWGMVLAGRVKTGGIKSTDESEYIPIEDRFYAGGSASVRGWSRAGLGPMADDDTPIGGNSLLESSLELRYPIWGLLSGALFCDAGNVWSESFSYYLDNLRYSAGLGIRIRTPIGPIRLDVAWPVADEETTAQLHISVGEAF